MSVKKSFDKEKKICKVTFRVTKEAAKGASTITLVGDFNQWNETINPLKSSKNGDFSITIEVPIGKEFQYRYLYDNKHWENDWDAEYYVATDFPGTENSAVKTYLKEAEF
jgi:1,4-alpha-glucan branching enzyme